MSFIKNHQIIVISIVIITLILLVFSAFIIKKWRNLSKSSNKKSLSDIIKQAKALIKSHKIKNKLSELYIFYGDFRSKRLYN